MYKKDFNAELPEYESLKAKVDSMKKKIHDLQSKRLQFPEGTTEREVSVWLVFMLIELKGTATICHAILQLCNGRAEIAWCLELHKISFSLKRQRVGFKISLGLEFAPFWSFECKRIEKILESFWLFWDFLITAFFNLSLSLSLSLFAGLRQRNSWTLPWDDKGEIYGLQLNKQWLSFNFLKAVTMTLFAKIG